MSTVTGQNPGEQSRRWLLPRGGLTATLNVMAGLPVAIVTFTVIVTLVSTTAGLAITAILAVPFAWLLVWSVRGFTALQRSRFRGTLGVDVATATQRYEGNWLRRLLARLVAGTTWRQILYHLLSLPLATIGFTLLTVSWSAGLAGIAALGYGWSLPTSGIFGWNMRSPGVIAIIAVGGVLLLLASPWLALGVAEADLACARALLGPSRSAALATRMESLARSRADVVDATDAERRRIERDLHDGTQQRLVSLAMNLGMARNELTDLPEPAREAIAAAHDEAKLALSELRDFVRGLHPAVLDDRGLDAALSGIAARAPVPVRLRVEVPRRCSRTIEAVAYFVVSESLSNVAKHAQASAVTVDVEQSGDRLFILVADDGRGGATIETGTGLRGLAQRVAAVDGTLRIDSPAGGPTEIRVELPCES